MLPFLVVTFIASVSSLAVRHVAQYTSQLACESAAPPSRITVIYGVDGVTNCTTTCVHGVREFSSECLHDRVPDLGTRYVRLLANSHDNCTGDFVTAAWIRVGLCHPGDRLSYPGGVESGSANISCGSDGKLLQQGYTNRKCAGVARNQTWNTTKCWDGVSYECPMIRHANDYDYESLVTPIFWTVVGILLLGCVIWRCRRPPAK
jgi:hypothetical protein